MLSTRNHDRYDLKVVIVKLNKFIVHYTIKYLYTINTYNIFTQKRYIQYFCYKLYISEFVDENLEISF